MQSSQFIDTIEEAIDKGLDDGVTPGFVYDTVISHDQTIGNYVWLQPKFGKLLWVEFEEPTGSGHWRHYDTYYWGRHGSVVNHDPDVLVEEHVREFVDSATKTISLRFWFQDINGKVVSMLPTREFYELEAAYFRRHGLCNKHYQYVPHIDVDV